MEAVPESIGIWPVRTRKSVVFPLPLSPIKPTRSPRSMVKLSWSKITLRPKVFSMLVNVARAMTLQLSGNRGWIKSSQRRQCRRQSFFKRYPRPPAEQLPGLLIRVTQRFPHRLALVRREHRRNLAAGPVIIALAQFRKRINRRLQDRKHAHGADTFSILPDDLSARRSIVVDDVESVSLDSRNRSGQKQSVGAIVDKRERQRPVAAHADEKFAEHDADAGHQHVAPRSVNHARPNDHQRQSRFSTRFPRNFFLGDLA